MKKKIIRISTVPMSLNLLLKGQLHMLSEDYEVLAVSSPGIDLETVSQREGVRTLAVPMERRISPLKDLISLYRLIVLFYREKPWMVHSLTPKAGLLAMIAGRICGVPVRIHTFTGLVFPSATGLKRKLLMATDRLTCACATSINPEGQGVKKNLEQFHITQKPLQIIGNGNINGIDLDYFKRTDDVMLQAAKLRESDTINFCFVGRLVHDKGIDELIAAFSILYADNNNCRLFLVGAFEDILDPLLPDTKEKILHHKGIRFMGWQDDIRPFLAASDIFVFPSYREGFPNVVLQAGAMGLPCIVTNINGCNEIIQDGVNGIIIPSKQKDVLLFSMRKMLIDNYRINMANKARIMIANRYDRDMLWKELKKYYTLFE